MTTFYQSFAWQQGEGRDRNTSDLQIQAKCQSLCFPLDLELYNITFKLTSTNQVKTALLIFFLRRLLTALSAAIHSSLQRAVWYSHTEKSRNAVISRYHPPPFLLHVL